MHQNPPLKAAYHLRGCLVLLCQVRRPKWTWQPADPSRILSGKTLQASSCSTNQDSHVLGGGEVCMSAGTLKRSLYLGDKGVNGRRGGVCVKCVWRCSFMLPQLGPDGLADLKLLSSKTCTQACFSYKRKTHVCFECLIKLQEENESKCRGELTSWGVCGHVWLQITTWCMSQKCTHTHN